MALNPYLNSKLPPFPLYLTSTFYPASSALTQHSPQQHPPNSSSLEKVCLLLTDGRCLVGQLIACDAVTNLALENCVERIIRSVDDEEASEEEPRGLFMVRGDNVVLCGLVDEELDGSIDWGKVRGEEIGGTKHV
jgi:U6 snRNA-associated Sm-like protein LSm8